ncbi:MAG: hypothetical protein AMXMBFR47_45770 [Planctomycetota bacterium]
MADWLAELTEVFAATPPTTDDSGTLEDLLDWFRSEGIVCAFVASSDAEVLALRPLSRGANEAAVTAARALSATLGETTVSSATVQIEGRLRKAIAIPRSTGRTDFVGLVVEEGVFEAREEPEFWTELRRRSKIACRAVQLSREVSSLRARARQLESDQLSLRRAHSENVTAVLQERETNLREKRRHIEELESEVRRRSAALREAMAKAEMANRAKTEYLVGMSDQIRAPITEILNLADAVGVETVSNAERRAAVAQINRRAGYLLTIIDDILDLSRIETGVMEVESIPTPPELLVGEVVSILRPNAEQKGIALELETAPGLPPEIVTDPARFRQILVNLVGNAIKFTEQGSVRVAVRLESETDQPVLCVSVTDTGVGIDPDELPNLFRPFVKAKSASAGRDSGSGLGLSIARNLAGLLGGTVEATSAPGRGSCFQFRLPLPSSASLRAAPSPTVAAPPTVQTTLHPQLRGRILVAEAVEDASDRVATLLGAHGLIVDAVASGRQAVERVLETLSSGQRPYDAVFLDMQTAELDGYSAARTLRRAGYGGPIVAMVGRPQGGEHEKCLSAGCDEFLARPIEREALLMIVRGCVRAAESPAE